MSTILREETLQKLHLAAARGDLKGVSDALYDYAIWRRLLGYTPTGEPRDKTAEKGLN